MSYISRDGILNDLQEELELDSIYYNDETNKGITEGLKLAIKNIKRFPTSDVAPVKHGEWIDKPTGAYSRMQSWCSACGKHSGIGSIESNRHKPYCPNCGVKMDIENSENKIN